MSMLLDTGERLAFAGLRLLRESSSLLRDTGDRLALICWQVLKERRHFVTVDGGNPIGPFDTEQDAHLAVVALRKAGRKADILKEYRRTV